MRVTAIIPTFNCAAYLPDAIRSVLDQSRRPDEVIVVDDGSVDDTAVVVRQFEREIVYIRTPNQGVAAARNTGLAGATGDCVAFLDADDTWYPRKLAVQCRVLEQRADIQGVCSDFSLVDQHGTRQQERFIKGKYRVFHAYGLDWPQMFPCHETVVDEGASIDVFHGDVFRALFLGNFVNTSSLLARRQALLDAGGFTVGRRTQEDYELWLKVASRGPLAFVDRPLLTFRRRPNQATSIDHSLQVVRDVAEVIEGMADVATRLVGRRLAGTRLGDVQRMLASSLISHGQPDAARRAMASAWAHDGLAPQLAFLYVWSWMPAALGDSLRRGYRRLRPRTAGAAR